VTHIADPGRRQRRRGAGPDVVRDRATVGFGVRDPESVKTQAALAINLLFWLSLVPFATAWMGENGFAPVPAALCRAVCFEDGRIVEHWGIADQLGLMLQVGAIPARERATVG